MRICLFANLIIAHPYCYGAELFTLNFGPYSGYPRHWQLGVFGLSLLVVLRYSQQYFSNIDVQAA